MLLTYDFSVSKAVAYLASGFGLVHSPNGGKITVPALQTGNIMRRNEQLIKE